MSDSDGADPQSLTDAELRDKLSALVAEYSRRAQTARMDATTAPQPLNPSVITPTDVVLTTRAMLDMFDIAAFELGMLG